MASNLSNGFSGLTSVNGAHAIFTLIKFELEGNSSDSKLGGAWVFSKKVHNSSARAKLKLTGFAALNLPVTTASVKRSRLNFGTTDKLIHDTSTSVKCLNKSFRFRLGSSVADMASCILKSINTSLNLGTFDKNSEYLRRPWNIFLFVRNTRTVGGNKKSGSKTLSPSICSTTVNSLRLGNRVLKSNRHVSLNSRLSS